MCCQSRPPTDSVKQHRSRLTLFTHLCHLRLPRLKDGCSFWLRAVNLGVWAALNALVRGCYISSGETDGFRSVSGHLSANIGASVAAAAVCHHRFTRLHRAASRARVEGSRIKRRGDEWGSLLTFFFSFFSPRLIEHTVAADAVDLTLGFRVNCFVKVAAELDQ